MAVAALITWLVTAVLGATMLATWARNGGVHGGEASLLPPPVVFGHFLLAAAGLVAWVVYLVADVDALAWAAFVDLVLVAGLGDVLVLRWRRARLGDGSASARPASAGRGDTDTLTRPASGTLAERHIAPGLVAAHGVFAVATVVLVFLTALGVAGS